MNAIKEFLDKKGIWLLLGIVLLFGVSMLYFRNATLDDDLYLRETMIMVEVLKQGEWIGNYAVGIHGFLFKLPVALIFLFTEVSLLTATVWTIILGILSLYLFYIILQKLFKSNLWALAGTTLLFTNFQFILNYPTYMREIPAVFCLLLVIYCLFFKKSRWFLGFSLLLLLDAKEYVMLMIAPVILIYIFYTQWGSFKNIIVENLKTFLPSLTLVLLMLFTTWVPLNTFLLSTIGVTETGVAYHLRHFQIESATKNRSSEEQRQIPIVELEREVGEVENIETEVIEIEEEIIEPKENLFITIINAILLYIGKLLYPYSFSFLSIPKILLFPSLLTSLFLFVKFKKEKRPEYMALALMLFFYFIIFVIKASFTRYIFPITPVVIIFLILFLKDLINYRKYFLTTIIITALLVIGGLFFEEDYLVIKIILNAVVLFLFFLYLYFEKYRNYIQTIVICLIAFFSFFVVMFFFYTKGQIAQYLLWGRDYEVEKVVEYFDEDEKIMLNDPGWDLLPKAYRKDTDMPAEFRWELKDWITRKENLKNLGNTNTYNLVFRDLESLRKQVIDYDIDRVGVVVSDLDGYEFSMEIDVDTLKDVDWLELENTIQLKNKTLFILKVVK